VLEALPTATVQALHRRVGEALERHQPEATERLAHHFCEAGDARRAVDYLRRAGTEAAAVHAYAAADGYLRRARTEQGRRPASVAARFDLLAEHEAVLDVLGDRDAQRRTVVELAELAAGSPRREAEVLRRRALLDAHAGDLTSAQETASSALATARSSGDAALVPPALLALGRVAAWAGDRKAAVDRFAEALRLPDLPVALELELRTTLASVLRELQRYDEAADQLRLALELAREHGDVREEAHALGVLGTVRMETGRSAEATELYDEAVDRCRRIGFRRGEGINLLNLANVRYARGDVAAALAAYDEAAAVFAELDDRRGEAAVRLNLGFVRHAILGDDDRAATELESAVAHFAATRDVLFEAGGRDALASIALRRGELQRARGELEQALALPGVEDHAWTVTQLLQRRAEVELAAGDPRTAHDLADDGLALVAEHDLADLAAGLLAVRGAALLARGDTRRRSRPPVPPSTRCRRGRSGPTWSTSATTTRSSPGATTRRPRPRSTSRAGSSDRSSTGCPPSCERTRSGSRSTAGSSTVRAGPRRTRSGSRSRSRARPADARCARSSWSR
jgi:tetratricopeptide (TPR) repeat protein